MSSILTLTWEEFQKECLQFLEISRQLDDTWSWEIKDPNFEGQSFLKYNRKLNDPTHEELLEIEYHIVYSISYQVPIIYFRAYKSDGKLLSFEEAWNLFNFQRETKYAREDMLSILTQMDHPIFLRPFLCLHPCRTSEILAATPKSRNRILTFISIMGPYLHLNLDNSYGLNFTDKCI